MIGVFQREHSRATATLLQLYYERLCAYSYTLRCLFANSCRFVEDFADCIKIKNKIVNTFCGAP